MFSTTWRTAEWISGSECTFRNTKLIQQREKKCGTRFDEAKLNSAQFAAEPMKYALCKLRTGLKCRFCLAMSAAGYLQVQKSRIRFTCKSMLIDVKIFVFSLSSKNRSLPQETSQALTLILATVSGSWAADRSFRPTAPQSNNRFPPYLIRY